MVGNRFQREMCLDSVALFEMVMGLSGCLEMFRGARLGASWYGLGIDFMTSRSEG